MDEYHRPVMVEEAIAGLRLIPNGLYYDATVGGGGHSFAILEREPTVRLIATDKDGDAIEEASRRLAPFKNRVQIVRADYKAFDQVLPEEKLDGFLIDLGVSSHQIDDTKRGFSYRAEDAPLDMRMDKRSALTADDVVNRYPAGELKHILRDFGEEPFAHAIVKNIMKAREKGGISTCGELRRLVEMSIPPKKRSASCAKRTFQAVRIEVNSELDGLEQCIRGLVGRLKKGGRAVILTFHSLEDRIVKNVFRDLSTACICPKSIPVCVCGRKQVVEEITRKPITASAQEMKENSRSTCAKLRIAEKIVE